MQKAIHLLKGASELVKEHKYADAVEIYLQATETDPNDARAWFGLGVCLYKIGNFEVAGIALERAKKMGYPRADEALARVQEAEHRRSAEGAGARPTAPRAPAAPRGARPAPAAGPAPVPPRPVVRPEQEKIQLEAFLRIMLVENIESDRQAITQAIKGTIRDVDVHSVPYGVSTSDTMSGTVHYDAAVLDWDEAPDAAAGLIQILKIKRPGLFIICLTDRWDPESSAQIMEAGGDYHIVKQPQYATVVPLVIARWARRDRSVMLQARSRAGQERGEGWPEALSALGEMLMVVGPDYQVLRANQAAMKGFRRGEEQIVGRSYCGLLYGYDEPPKSCPLLQVLEGGVPAEGEVKHAGLKTTFQISAWPMFTQAGKVSAAVAVLRERPTEEVSESVRQRERLYRNLTERAGAGVAMVGPNGALHYANQSFCAMVDQTLDELLDKPIEGIVIPQDQEDLREYLEVAVDMGESGGRLNLQREDGTKMPTEARIGRITSERETYLVITFIEVGELVQAEQSLWAQANRLTGILDEGLDRLQCGVIVLDEEGRVTWLNRPAADLLGQEREQAIGTEYLRQLANVLADHAKEAGPAMDAIRQAHEGGRPVEQLALVVGGQHSDGLSYWSTPLNSPSPSVARVEHFYPLGAGAPTGADLPLGMADAVQDLLFTADGDGCITWVNPAAPGVAGRPREQLEGLDIAELAAQEGRTKLHHLVQTVLKRGRHVEAEEVLMARADGSRYWGRVTLLPVTDGAGSEVQGLRGSVRDVTDRKVQEAIHAIIEDGAVR